MGIREIDTASSGLKSTAQSASVVCQTWLLSSVRRYLPFGRDTTRFTWASSREGISRRASASPRNWPVSPKRASGGDTAETRGGPSVEDDVEDDDAAAEVAAGAGFPPY